MPNENCLEGMKCPKCGHEDAFGIACDIVMLVTDEGIYDNIGDYDWDDDAYCECRECGHHGTVKDFTEPTAKTSLKTLVDRLKELTKEHERLEGYRDFAGTAEGGWSFEEIDQRENEIFEECFSIAQDIVDMNLGA